MESQPQTNEEILNNIFSRSIDKFIETRLQNPSSLKTLFWFLAKSYKDEIVYSSELADFLGVTRARANDIFLDYKSAGIIIAFKKSVFNEYRFIQNGHQPIIQKHEEKIKNKLGLKDFKPEDLEKMGFVI